MTKEEAIKILESKMDGSVDTSYEWTEAVRMAIEALKNEINCIKGVCKMDTAHRGDIIYRNEVAVAIDMADGDTKMADRKDVWDLVQGIPSVNCTRILIGSDLISRQDAIDALGEEPDIWNDTEEEWAYRNAWVEHISAIKALPSADRPTVDKEYMVELIQEAVYDGEACAKLMDMVDRPTGEWIEHEDPYGFFDTIPVCSECGHTTKMRERYNYCPMCGAKMGGDVNEL